jgi:hypothetical protein
MQGVRSNRLGGARSADLRARRGGEDEPADQIGVLEDEVLGDHAPISTIMSLSMAATINIARSVYEILEDIRNQARVFLPH